MGTIYILCAIAFFVATWIIFYHFIPRVLANYMAKKNKKFLQGVVNLNIVQIRFREECRECAYVCHQICLGHLALGFIVLLLLALYYPLPEDIYAGITISHTLFSLFSLYLEDHINPMLASFWKYYKKNKL